MLTEARVRSRSARSVSIAHPRAHARHGATSSAALVYAFMKPLSTLLSKLRLHL
ncbi:MAG: hypothetical protein RRA94_12045 [Bacteroidota bacterium]|nr:hypothetical protein [Bacteroidota bacterium]